MKNTLIVLFSILLSTHSLAAEVGGIACPTKDGYRLFGYWPEDSTIHERLGSFSEREIINQIDFAYSVNGFNSVTLKSDVDEFHFSTIKKYGYKFRLSDTDLSHCEGVFLLTDTGEKWVSGYVYDQLAPYEKVAIYIEFMQKHLSFLRRASRKYQARRAGFYLTEEAQEKDINQWMANYNAYLGSSDIIILLDYFQFDSQSLVFSDEDFRGVLSDTEQLILAELSYINVSKAQIIYKQFGVSEVQLPKTVILTAYGGEIKTRHFTMEKKERLHCAKLEDVSFLRDKASKINVFLAGESVCFNDGFFYRMATIEDFQLLK